MPASKLYVYALPVPPVAFITTVVVPPGIVIVPEETETVMAVG